MIEEIDYQLCDDCGVCMDVCPTDVFRVDPETRKYVIFYLSDCQTCFNCEIECPRDAITVGPIRKERISSWSRNLPHRARS